MNPFFLYMLRCSDGSYYVGHTDDLEKRYQEHVHGVHDGYTSTRRPVEVVFVCEFATRVEAQERELQIKGWSRAKKEALIRGDWPRIHELARRGTRPSTLNGAPFDSRGPKGRARSGQTEAGATIRVGVRPTPADRRTTR